MTCVKLIGSILSLCLWLCCPAGAGERLALLIGNGDYNDNVGRLVNPPHDVKVVGDTLEKLNFKTTTIVDAGFDRLNKEIKKYIARVHESGSGTISFVYYSGHGAADANRGLNYLIPVDAPTAEDSSLWENSVELKADLIDKLVTQARNAIHFVVFDACRNELQLKVKGKKAFEVDGKGFLPIEETNGILIAFSTAAKRTASDVGIGGGPYARALAEELIRPGNEAVVVFRQVELRVSASIGQRPWWNATGLDPIYLAGQQPDSVTKLPELSPIETEKSAFQRERAAEKRTMQLLLKEIGDAGIESAGLFHSSKKWSKRSILACFMDGNRERRAYVANVARQWTLPGEIDFDFGSWDDPRGCSPETAHDIAITLKAFAGNWSYIGTDSKEAPPDLPTLALGSIGLATDEDIKAGKVNREILHEFGHALGFDHSWKAPRGAGRSCESEFNWDRIYEQLGAQNGWSRETVDHNLKSWPASKDVAVGTFDKNSIMNHQMPPDFFVKGRESPCYLEPLNELSLRDKLAVFTAYK